MRHLRITALTSALVALLLPTLARAGDPFSGLAFRSIGPAVSGGRLGAVAGTDADPSLYYAGAAGGGLWKSTNAGASWQPVFDGQAVASIGAIAIDPAHKSTVWVGTGEANPRNDVTQGDGVYKTDDGGKTWQHVLVLRNALIGRIVVDPRDTMRVVVAVLGDPFADDDARGIYRTVDGGAHWDKTLYAGPSTGASDVVASPANPDDLFAGMWSYRRTGWSSQSGGANGGLYHSTDGGARWKRLSGNGLPSGATGRIGLAIAPSKPSRIYALIESASGLLWRSDDGGATWSNVSNDTLMDERPFYYTTLFVDPADPNRLWTESVHMAVSSDAGAHFTITGRGIHGDHHGMWISNDGRRIIEANDGGVAFSNDGGATWSAPKNLPISQLYRIGFSREVPYRVCSGLQDNGIWCAPADPLNPRGISASQWTTPGGGDGTWAVPDPLHRNLIWMSSGGQNWGGDVEIYNEATMETREIAPYIRDQNVVPPKDLTYRLNWETPIAFDPFDPRLVYTAGNVVFATRDAGANWTVISGDLTRNDAAHELMTGGITLDGTGAETSGTVLDIEPSRAARGELWIGTDDGYVQLTRDGGAHWSNVTPPGIAPYGRFATISASAREPGVAYAVYDAHMIGDRTAYVFATHDFGKNWKRIDRGLPGDDEARSILADPVVPGLMYLGLERSFWMSWDDGISWTRVRSNLPPVSIRDIRLQPDSNDLLLATHGRGAYVLDDVTPLRDYPQAKAAGTYMFPIRNAIAWNEHSSWGTRTDGAAPEYGALITYYLSAPAKAKPSAEIIDGRGNLLRTLRDLDNAGGYNRMAWDLTSEDADAWTFTPEWNERSLDSGAPVVPGRYTVRLHVDGATLTQTVVVVQDPRTHYTASELQTHRDRVVALLDDLSRVDRALNVLSAVALEAPLRAQKLADAATATQVRAIGLEAQTLAASMTSNPKNDQDNDFLVDVLRERLQTQIDSYFGSLGPATQEQRREDAELQRLTAQRMQAFDAYVLRLDAVDAQVKAANLPSLRTVTPKP
jgi:photosystem II stability/assembly factor-like uncharacterized protein